MCFRITIKIFGFLSVYSSSCSLTSGHTDRSLIRAARMVGDGARDKGGERNKEDEDEDIRKEEKS